MDKSIEKVYCAKCGKYITTIDYEDYDQDEDWFCDDCYEGRDSLNDSDEIWD